MVFGTNQLIRRLELSPLVISVHPRKKKEGNGGQGEVDKLPLSTAIQSPLSANTAKVLIALLSAAERSLLIGCRDHFCLENVLL